MKSLFNLVKSILKTVCIVVGAVVIIGLIGVFISAYRNMQGVEIADNSYLEIDLSDDYFENAQTTLLDDVMGYEKVEFTQLLKSVEFASIDKRIKGIVLRLDSLSLDLAQTQDLASSLQNFKQSGKKIYAYSRGFGSLGQGNREYYLATFADEIFSS